MPEDGVSFHEIWNTEGQPRGHHRKEVFVLVDGEFDPALAATLPRGLERLMHGGPRD